MDEYITRAEHDEFCRRMEETHKRQDKRLEFLEEGMRRLNELNTSIEKLAANMENMLKELIRQGNRLEELEKRDGEKWRNVVACAIAGVVGMIAGYVGNKLGFGG